MHCDMPSTRCGSVTGGWRRVAWIDMTCPSGLCPSNLRTLTSPKRMCARAVSAGCTSVSYPTLGVNYTSVCGRAIGYHFGSPDVMEAYHAPKTINHPYVDGLSITYDSSRRHLWTHWSHWSLPLPAKQPRLPVTILCGIALLLQRTSTC